ncbi:MAG: hypothetical protein K6F97_01365 [Lachnospiraceae bacterium]|nr:hypothetical protein [Lachnospiraceae bacterium]
MDGNNPNTATNNAAAQQAQNQQQAAQNAAANNAAQAATPAFDYEKLASIVAGKQAVTENTVVKSYLSQQGLSDAEVKEAIEAFKAEKAKRTPDINVLKADLAKAQAQITESNIRAAATTEALNLGVAPSLIPYIIKMADLTKAAGENGSVDTAVIKTQLEQVLKDVPELKGAVNSAENGFSIGGNANTAAAASDEAETLKNIFGIRNKSK